MTLGCLKFESGNAGASGKRASPLPLVGGIMHLTYHKAAPHKIGASSAKAEGAGAPEIEVTPQMVEAGRDALMIFSTLLWTPDRSRVCCVFQGDGQRRFIGP